MKGIKSTWRLSLILFLFTSTVLSVLAAPTRKLWPLWEANDPNSAVIIDHSLWDQFLSKYVVSGHPSGINRVTYSQVSSADKQQLELYLERLQATPVRTLTRKQQLAYWINLYNAMTVKVILDYYPVESITKINPDGGLIKKGPWDAKLMRIEGQEVSLNDIEHRILRPIWDDPRLHYAVNCASLGCPNLQPQAYTAENADGLLELSAQEYINHPRGVSVRGNRIQVSSIYSWFREDFGDSQAGVIEHLLQYAEAPLQKSLSAFGGKLKFDYDWRINEE